MTVSLAKAGALTTVREQFGEVSLAHLSDSRTDGYWTFAQYELTALVNNDLEVLQYAIAEGRI
jgi:hypothetical protein